MKKLFYFLIVAVIFVSCEPDEKQAVIEPKKQEYRYEYYYKVVKGKSQEQKSDQVRRYSLYNDQFYNETNIYTVFYVAYTDGSSEEVDGATYAKYDKGDTIPNYKAIPIN